MLSGVDELEVRLAQLECQRCTAAIAEGREGS